MKICTKCLIEKSTAAFQLNRAQCRDCRNQQRNSRPKKNYEISVAEKICRCCNTNKTSNNFSKNPRHKTGLNVYCISCMSNKNRERYIKNPEPKKEYSKKYSKENREVVQAKSRIRNLHRRKTDIFFMLCHRLRSRLLTALKNTTWKKNTKFSEYIGCDRETLISHIESQFVEGMTWDNRSEWHIDHKIPLISAKTEEELYRLCHYTNLQPMWAIDNIKKGGKLK